VFAALGENKLVRGEDFPPQMGMGKPSFGFLPLMGMPQWLHPSKCAPTDRRRRVVLCTG
jgi:hypothetical protein